MPKIDERAVAVAAELRVASPTFAEMSCCVIPSCSVLNGRADRRERDVVRALHQRDLGGRFDHAAAGRDGRRDDELRLRQLLAHAVVDEEADALLEADLARGGAAVAEDLRDQLVRDSRLPARRGRRSGT